MEGTVGSGMWLVEPGHVWRQASSRPVPWSHRGCEFTRSRQTAWTFSVNIWEKGESLSGLRLSAVLLLVAPEVPTVPSVRVPVWMEIWGRARAAAAWISEGARALPRQPNEKTCRFKSLRSLLSQNRFNCEIRPLEPTLGRPHFPAHVCLWHVQILNGRFTVITPVIILISG